MPTIENHSEHPFEFPERSRMDGDKFIPANRERSVIVPRVQVVTKPDGKEERTPGIAKVSAEKLAEMQGHRTARHWFGPLSLVVVSDKAEAKAKS
ncbi:MAG TPA: hypothetical protein VN719_10090 [Gemmatimonadales bacterium]|nr:hypothetical protein [Gemmatimonadales bacterium]